LNRLYFIEIYLSRVSWTYQIESMRFFNFGEYEYFAQTFKHSLYTIKKKEVGWVNEKG